MKRVIRIAIACIAADLMISAMGAIRILTRYKLMK